MENNLLLDISRISGRRGSKKQDVLPCMRKKKIAGVVPFGLMENESM